MLALPLSVLVHLIAALIMRPDYRNVSDFAVDFQIIEVTPGPPKQGAPKPEPKEEPKPEEEKQPEREPSKKSATTPPKVADNATKLPKKTTPEPAPAGIPEGADAGVGSGICLHDLFVYTESKPAWLLYISMASFRGTVFQKEFGRTFESFDLGRRLTRYMGMNPAEEVEAIFVSSNDIFDWRSFRVVGSYDSGEEKLKGEMSNRLKARQPYFKWREEDGGFVGRLPGEFEWRLIGSGRVFAIRYSPPVENPAAVPAMPIPDNPFAGDAGSNDAEQASDAERPVSPRQGWPKQLPCIDVSNEKKEKKKTLIDIGQLSKSYLEPDDEGHFPVALLSTTDPRAVGVGRGLGRRLGFSHALFRGYFTDPVRIEGVLAFNGDEKGVQMLAEGWAADAKRFAGDPILAVTGVSHLLENLSIDSRGSKIHVSLTLTERQVLSTLLFLQLQGKALERQLKAKQ